MTRYYTIPSKTTDTRYGVAYRVHPGRLEWRCTCPSRRRCWHIDHATTLFRAGLAGGGRTQPFAIQLTPEEVSA